MDLADHGVSRDIAEFGGNLARGKSGLPELLQLLDAIVRPSQYRHRIVPFAMRGQGRAAMPGLKNSCGQNPLGLAGRFTRARAFTPNDRTFRIRTRRTR